MAILLFRVDERLIHGQVVVGWGNELRPDTIVVVDDHLARSDWEQDLYRLGLVEGMHAVFETVADAMDHLDDRIADSSRTVLLTRDITTMLRLAGAGQLRGREINIGGLHYASGRDAVLPYVYLDADQRDALSALLDHGADVSAQDLPGGRRVRAERLLRGGDE
jgi:PTS system mannose-specific IIB component/fructoselysine and glucoselysine-specific PTS system IIB component